MKFSLSIASGISVFLCLSQSSFALLTPAAMRYGGVTLARMTFDLKDLVNRTTLLQVNTANAAMVDANIDQIFGDADKLFDGVLASNALLPGTPIIASAKDQQSVYETNSQFVQSNFELMSAFEKSAASLTQKNALNAIRVPASIRQVEGVVDSYLFNVMAVFPSNSTYRAEVINQKSQVDAHYRRAKLAYRLASANIRPSVKIA